MAPVQTPTALTGHGINTPARFVEDPITGEEVPLRHPLPDPAPPMPLTVQAAADPATATNGALLTLPPTPPPQEGRPRLSEKQRELRGDAMLIKRICGAKIKEIAEEFNLAVSTTGNLLKEAERRSLITVARDKVLTLVPKAIAVVDAHLEEGDKDVALETLKGVGLLGRRDGLAELMGSAGPADGEESFEAFRVRITRKGGATSEQAGAAPDSEGNGEVIDLQPANYRVEPSAAA